MTEPPGRAYPVARSILRDDEPAAVWLWIEDAGEPGDVWVSVRVGEDVFEDVFSLLLSSASWEGQLRAGDDALAGRLADALEDWVPETSFGWGQQRKADPRAHLRA